MIRVRHGTLQRFGFPAKNLLVVSGEGWGAQRPPGGQMGRFRNGCRPILQLGPGCGGDRG